MLLSYQSIVERCLRPTDLSNYQPMITPFVPFKQVINGKSAGCSSASYDCRIDHDLTLGVNPAFIITRYKLKFVSSFEDVRENEHQLCAELEHNPPMQALAYTMEDFHMPHDVSGQVSDKSTWARHFVSAFNTFIDPGFQGNLTIELVNHGTEPVVFKQGDPICQILFTLLDQPTNFPYAGKYQHQTKAAHGPRLEQAPKLFAEPAQSQFEQVRREQPPKPEMDVLNPPRTYKTQWDDFK